MSDDTSLAADLSAAMSAPADTSAASDATTDATEASTGTATTAPATDATATDALTTAQTQQPKQGPIPFDVHSKALDNARAKAVAEAQASWDAEHGWVRGVDRNAVMEADRLGRLLQTSKADFVRELIADGDLPPDLVSEFARVLSSRRGQTAPAAESVDLEPDVPLLDANGQATGMATYSAQKVQALMQHAVQQAVAEVSKSLKPLQDSHEAREAERRTDARKTFATTLTTETRKQPHFAEHEPAIKAEFAKASLRNPDDQNEVEAALTRAYVTVLTRDVLPNLQSANVRAVVQGQQQKAEVNTVKPGAGGSGTPKDIKDMSWSEAFKHELASRAR